MTISPESIKGQATQTQGEVVMKMKPEAVHQILKERINGVVNGVEPQATLFVMTHNTLSSIKTDTKGVWVLNKGRLQKIALGVMREFGFDSKSSLLEEMSKSREVRGYPSSIHEGLIFRRELVKNDVSSLTRVSWTVHGRNAAE